MVRFGVKCLQWCVGLTLVLRSVDAVVGNFFCVGEIGWVSIETL